MTNKNKKLMLVGGIILLLIGTITLTYAFFSTGGTQDLANSFSSGCLRITIENETNSISLNNTYPVSDVEGLSTTPYTFTIKNTCSKSTNYEINLESINQTSNSLNPSYIKVSLSSDTFDNKVSILGSNEARKYYSSNSYASFNLYTGSIDGNTTKTFNLREWIDYDTTVSQGASKTYTSKINVIANPDLNVVATPEIKTTYANKVLTGVINGNPSIISYCTSTSNVCTPNETLTITNNEVKIDLENNKKEQIVCTKLDNTTYCSNPVLVTEADLNILAINLKQSDGTYQETDKVPTSGYILNTEKTTCEVNGTTDTSITITYNEGNLTFNGLKKNTKCYLYFDKNASGIILANKTISTRTDFGTTLTTDTTGTIYTAEDDDGTSYYFSGNPTDNWVRFAGFYWRIIRINGDGTIRMIYQGTAANTTGTGTQTTTSAFNSSYNNNMYVGYMYTSGNAHGLGTSSTIKGVLDSWYDSNLASYASYIDTNAGFCGDRNVASGHSSYPGNGTGTTATVYAPADRLLTANLSSWKTTQTPTLKCSNSSDLYTLSSSSKGNKALSKPIGLITSDEVVYGGGFGGTSNSSYYLYTGQYYWTMSPSNAGSDGWAYVFYVFSSGDLDWDGVNWTEPGVRPVINLKADTAFADGGTGTSSNPYVVS